MMQLLRHQKVRCKFTKLFAKFNHFLNKIGTRVNQRSELFKRSDGAYKTQKQESVTTDNRVTSKLLKPDQIITGRRYFIRR